MHHPAILVDVERALHMPLVAHRAVRFAHAASFGWLPSRAEPNVTTLSHEDGAFLLRKPFSPARHELMVGNVFDVDKRRYRVERDNDIVLDARRIGNTVMFNIWYCSSKSQSWRGFRLDDANRSLIDVVVAPQMTTHVSRSMSGIPVGAIANLTVSQRAAMDEAIAAAIVAPLLRDGRSMSEALVTWDGDALDMPSTRVAGSPVDHADGVVRAFLRLVGRRAPKRVTDSDLEELKQIRAAPAKDVASVVRALFRDEWALESAVREQAALIDVDNIPRVVALE